MEGVTMFRDPRLLLGGRRQPRGAGVVGFYDSTRYRVLP
jgi:hypothetical protein